MLFFITASCIDETPEELKQVRPLGDTYLISDGYPGHFSCFQGERISFFINVIRPASITLYLVDVNDSIYDSLTFNGSVQNPIPNNASTIGFKYKVSFHYRISNRLPSGMYHWRGTEVWFLVKEKKKTAPIVIVYPSNTEQAYNNAGGKSLYDFNSTGKRARSVSFDRPINYRISWKMHLHDFTMGFLQWMEKSDYDYRLIADSDLEYETALANAKAVVIIGHSEYWSRTARESIDTFVNRGGNLAVFSGNTMWWQVRYSRKYCNLVCYKNLLDDPIKDPLLKTVNWTDSILNYPILSSIGADFLHGGYGSKADLGWDGYKIVAENSPLLKGTGLQNGDIISVKTHEFDGTLLRSSQTALIDPVPDIKALGAYRVEIVGFDRGKPHLIDYESVATFIVYQPTATSGVVVNTASTDWCNSNTFFGVAGGKVQMITRNILDGLSRNSNLFTP